MEDLDPLPENARFYYVYMLLCNDGHLYTGCTHNLKERFNRHQRGWVPITKDRLPVRLLWCCAFPGRSKAFAFEQYLKSGSGRAFAKKTPAESGDGWMKKTFGGVGKDMLTRG